MKDLRLVLPIILLIVLVLLFAGCKGVVPSPGATEDDSIISGHIKMPYCCLLTSELEENVIRTASKYSGDECYDETEGWRIAPEALVELRKMDGQCKKPEYDTETDATGYYEFTDVEPGLYILTTYCPTDEGYFLKDVIEVDKTGVDREPGIPDCDSTALALVIEYISGEYCHCHPICPCFVEEYSTEYKLIQKIAESEAVDMQVNIPAIITHEDFGSLCNEDDQGNLIQDDLVDLVCSKLQSCCVSPGQTNGGDDDDPGISLTKSVDADCYTPGGTLTYSFTITNTGDYDFSQVILTDDLLKLNENIGSLSTGESWDSDGSSKYQYVVPQDFQGLLTNNAEATGTYLVTSTISDQDSVSLEICEEPPSASLTIEKVVTGDYAPSDWSFDFTISPAVGAVSSFTLDDENTDINFNDVVVGTEYTITETDPGTSWSTTVIGGDNANPCHITLNDGDDETVTFTNAETCGSCHKYDEEGCFTIESWADYNSSTDTTTFTFYLCNECATSISHWTYGVDNEFGTGFCIDPEDIFSSSPAYSEIGKDGQSEFWGIKWTIGGSFDYECRTFTLELYGCRVDEFNAYKALVKAGTSIAILDVCGPLCD